MIGESLRRNVWALTLIVCVAVISYSLRANAGDQKQQKVQQGTGVQVQKKADPPAAKTPNEAERIFCGDHTDTPRCCRVNGGYWVSLGAGDPGGCNFHGYNY